MCRLWIAAILIATFAVACSDGGSNDSPDYRYLAEDSAVELAGETENS